ncbi:hypothetical protein CEXT_352891 [Caerostris extrusa]|uniref:Uncharacterized protein n=1 Tax=Caerostris extrusa TaxID=172846 RepID=A0AAV4WMW3_CAEEX|nr:hypothetical protein CEXT_352891 [Caerostris extrusa]
MLHVPLSLRREPFNDTHTLFRQRVSPWTQRKRIRKTGFRPRALCGRQHSVTLDSERNELGKLDFALQFACSFGREPSNDTRNLFKQQVTPWTERNELGKLDFALEFAYCNAEGWILGSISYSLLPKDWEVFPTHLGCCSPGVSIPRWDLLTMCYGEEYKSCFK